MRQCVSRVGSCRVATMQYCCPSVTDKSRSRTRTFSVCGLAVRLLDNVLVCRAQQVAVHSNEPPRHSRVCFVAVHSITFAKHVIVVDIIVYGRQTILGVMCNIF